MEEGNAAMFLTAILKRDLRNDFFFFSTNLPFPIFIWTFISPFLFGLLYPFSFWTFISLFLWTFISLLIPFYFTLIFLLFPFFLDFSSITVTFWISSNFLFHF